MVERGNSVSGFQNLSQEWYAHQKHYRCTTIATKSKIYVAKVQRKCNVKFALQKEACGDII